MSETPQVSVGHNRYDPIGHFFDEVALSGHTDESVAKQCAPALRNALDIMRRFDDLKSRNTHDSIVYSTPELEYSSLLGSGGPIQLQARIPRLGGKTARPSFTEVEPDHATCALVVRPDEQAGLKTVTLFELTNRFIRKQSADGLRRGGHRELNYFMLVTRRIGETAAKLQTEPAATA